MTTVSISGRNFTVGPSQYNKENKKKQKNWQERKNLFTDDLVNYIELSKRIYVSNEQVGSSYTQQLNFLGILN